MIITYFAPTSHPIANHPSHGAMAGSWVVAW